MSSDNWIVIKFGGTSVSTLKNWQKIKKICEKHLEDKQSKVVVVCSALSGISNKLCELIDLSVRGNYQASLGEVLKSHLDFAKSLEIKDPSVLLKNEFEELSNLALGLSLLKIYNANSAARIMTLGELMLTKLAHNWLLTQDLDTKFLDMRKYLTAEDSEDYSNEKKSYLSAVCKSGYDEEFSSAFERLGGSCFLTQGFIASDKKGHPVLLGRGGSDVSAAIIASKLQAKKVEIWSDVPGLFTSNPRQVSSARLIKRLDYTEAQELASCGAKVLHPRCLKPLQRLNIPIELKWIEEPGCSGTFISSKLEKSNLRVKAVIAKSGVYMISMDSVDMWQECGFLADAFACFKRYGLSIDLIATSQSNVTVTLDDLADSVDNKTFDELLKDLSKFCSPKKIGPCSRVSLVGRNIKSFFPELGIVLETFKDKKCYLITQASSELNFSFLVEEDDVNLIVERIHSLCFGGLFDEVTLGRTWKDLFEGPKAKQEKPFYERNWWFKQSKSLMKMANNKEAQYIYNIDVVKEKISDFKKLESVARVNYALKANYHKDILDTLYKEGSCFDCVSFQEIEFLKKTFPNISSDRIIFTPNFAPLEEYEKALDYGSYVTLDNLYLLETHGETFSGREIFIRVDPGSGKGHHPHVRTAGKDSKFGISFESLARVRELAQKYKIKIVGLHAHLGSGVLDATTWLYTARFLADTAKSFEFVKFLNLGGGFGVPENSLQQPIDFHKLNELLNGVVREYPQYKLWVEPGRYLVAECGVLLMNVTQIKQKVDKVFVGVNTGMNSLIRPSLYGSYHEIVNLNCLNSQSYMIADIVGPICETGDVLGYDRCLPVETKKDDIILLSNAGAYGRVMSSSYNKRQPAEEVLFSY